MQQNELTGGRMCRLLTVLLLVASLAQAEARAGTIGTGTSPGTTMGSTHNGTTTIGPPTGGGTWTYDPPPDLSGPIPAYFIFNMVQTTSAVMRDGDLYSQPDYAGQFEILRVSDGANLLTATFSGATLFGSVPSTGGGTLDLTAESAGSDPVSFTSDFVIDIVPPLHMDIKFMGVVVDPLTQDFTSLGGFSATFDAFSFDFVSTPEPASLALAGFGVISLLGWAGKRRLGTVG
jgi:hypothetical protein